MTEKKHNMIAHAIMIASFAIAVFSSSSNAQTGDELMAKGKHKAAIKAYEIELKTKPNDVELLAKTAAACDKDGWYGKSFVYWEKVIKTDKSGNRVAEAKKNAAFAHRWVAISYYDTGMQLDWVLMHLDEAAKLDPALFDAYYWKARILYEKGKLKDAVAPLEAALKVKPGDKDAKWLLDVVNGAIANGSAAYLAYAEAYNQYDKKQYDQALVLYKSAVESNPKFGAAHSWIGRINMEKGNYEEAVASYQKAVDLEPGNKRHAWFLKTCKSSLEKNSKKAPAKTGK